MRALNGWSLARAPILVALPVIVAIPPRDLWAQDRPSLSAAEVTSEITIDGRLDEAAWRAAGVATGFRQFEPSEGNPASQPTEVRVLYGPGSLFVGATLGDADPGAIEAALGRRDDFNRADWFLVSIDAYLDRRTAYTFGVNAAGVQYDATQADGGGFGGPGGPGGGGGGLPGMDASWDAIWASDVRTTADGWTVELEIPYSMLRFPRAGSQTWGIQFSRHIPRLGEQSEWPLVPRAERANQVALFADLTGLTGIVPRRNVQILPYSVARLETHESPTEPGETDGTGELDIGGDLKVGLGPNITLDATINPDFGQVESDPAVLNLTAFETVFEERRPFFVEGSQIYAFGVGPGELLYTRRIGGTAPLIGAAKVSGRTAGGLSFGLLAATTGDDFDPDRHYGAARASQQFGNSRAGGMVTLFDSPTEDLGRGRAAAAGADWDVRFLDNQYGVEGFASFTDRWWTEGGVDAERGFAGKVWVRKREGAWQGFGGVEVFSDEFNPNDVGQLRFNNTYVLIASVDHDLNDNRPFGPFQRASIDSRAIQQYTYEDRVDQGLELALDGRGTLRGFQTVELGIEANNLFGGYDIFETRGGGPWAVPTLYGLSAEFGTDERRAWTVEPDVASGIQEGGGRSYELGFRGEWSVSDRLSLSGNLSGEWETDMEAWSSNETFLRTDTGWLIGRESGAPSGPDREEYTAFDDGGALDAILSDVLPVEPDTYWVPVFGARDSRAMDLTLRSTYTFTPHLSIQLYAQLFAAEGRYDAMRILRTPDDLAPFDAFPKRNEFAFSSLQSNAVLRWEYRPGSTLYVVWTHGRSDDHVLSPLGPWAASPYDRSLGTQIGDTFSAFPENGFLLKLSYAFLN
ncbi:MAG: DUF5916 domain-containing protein [Gemmatimonadota bacterium]